jgi:DNA-binding XRE family transcriptional regulator
LSRTKSPLRAEVFCLHVKKVLDNHTLAFIIGENLAGGNMKNSLTANAIKGFRARLGFSQSMLADKLGVGRSTVAKWETGENVPPGDTILKIQEWCEKQEGSGELA